MVKQSNQIVQFLKQLELDVDLEYGIEEPSTFGDTIEVDREKVEKIQENYLVKRLIVWETVTLYTKNVTFIGIKEHPNIIENYVMLHS